MAWAAACGARTGAAALVLAPAALMLGSVGAVLGAGIGAAVGAWKGLEGGVASALDNRWPSLS